MVQAITHHHRNTLPFLLSVYQYMYLFSSQFSCITFHIYSNVRLYADEIGFLSWLFRLPVTFSLLFLFLHIPYFFSFLILYLSFHHTDSICIFFSFLLLLLPVFLFTYSVFSPVEANGYGGMEAREGNMREEGEESEGNGKRMEEGS